MPCTGGKPAAVTEAEDGSVGKKGKQKVSRKERIQRKRDQKRAERQAGSDDEDLGQGAGSKLPHNMSHKVVLTLCCRLPLSVGSTGFSSCHRSWGRVKCHAAWCTALTVWLCAYPFKSLALPFESFIDMLYCSRAPQEPT